MSATIVRMIFLGMVLCSAASYAEKASMQQMVDDALIPLVRTKNSIRKKQKIRDSMQELVDSSRANAADLRSATAVFRRGRNVENTVSLLEADNLKLIAVDVKAPLNEEGVINTIMIGSDDLFAIEGSMEQRLQYAIELNRNRMRQISSALLGKKHRDYEAMIDGDLLVFKVEVIGTADELVRFANQEEVTAIFQDSHSRKIKSYEYVVNEKSK